MSQAVKCNIFLYADDTCLVCQHKDINEIEKQLNKDFESICDWFGKNKTKSILFATKLKMKKVRKLNIKYGDIQIKQHSKVKYLGCMPDETMALSVTGKINKLKFTYWKNKFLTPTLRQLPCNALIQPNFNYASSAWYSKLTKNLENTIQTFQNKCKRFCLQLDKITHIYYKESETLNWLPMTERFNQFINSFVFKYINDQCPNYLNEVFQTIYGKFSKIKMPFPQNQCRSNAVVLHCSHHMEEGSESITQVAKA